MVDSVIGKRYRLAEKIGTGGMADVYKAHDEVLGRSVAVKIMHPQYAADPTFAQRFRQEAQAAANLQSPNIVNIYDWGQDGQTYYIVMEYVRGTDLKTVIKTRGALPAPEAANIAAQVCSALAIAHGYDIIHRDIKPHNIMVMPDGTVKVMDFGIAAAGNTGLTEDGSVLGTAHYVSPEQALGKPLTAASDLYSLGVVLYETSTGRLPFDADGPVAIALKHVHESPVRPTETNPAFDRNLEAIIGRALTKDPKVRYQTADDMRRDLLRISRTTATDATTVSPAIGTAGASAAAATAAAGRTSVMPQASAGYAGLSNGASTLNGGPEIYEVPEDNARKVWLWVGAVVAILLVLLGTAWGLGLFGGGQVEVPDVTGKPLEQAVTALEDAGLVVGDIEEQASDTAEPGSVIAQDPSGGEKADKGSKVTLTISLGTEDAEIPNIVGMTETEARAALEANGFTADPQPAETSAEVPAGEVISQSPVGGEMAPKGTKVAYVISLGIETVEVPNVVTLKSADAKKKLEDEGFSVTIEEENSATVKAGIVISQNPNAGLTVGAGTEVVIVVSLGPAEDLVLVPDVVDMTDTAAIQEIEKRGLKADVTYDPSEAPTGLVLEQSPTAGQKVEKGTTVSIIVDKAS